MKKILVVMIILLCLMPLASADDFKSQFSSFAEYQKQKDIYDASGSNPVDFIDEIAFWESDSEVKTTTTKSAGSQVVAPVGVQNTGSGSITNSANRKPFGFLSRTNPLAKVFLMVGSFFDFSMLKQNSKLTAGFLRFLFFAMILALYRSILLKTVFKGDNKTASIVSTVLALISVFMMPESWLMMNGGMVATVAGLILPLGATAGAIYIGYMATKNENDDNYPLKILALIIILVVMMFLEVFRNITMLGLILMIPKNLIKRWLK